MARDDQKSVTVWMGFSENYRCVNCEYTRLLIKIFSRVSWPGGMPIPGNQSDDISGVERYEPQDSCQSRRICEVYKKKIPFYYLNSMDLNGEHRLLIDRVKAGNEQALNFCQCRSVAGVSSNLGCQYGCNFLHHTKGILSVGKYPLHFPRNFDSSCYILNDCEDPSSVRSMPGTPKRIMPSTTGRISK